MELVFGNSPLYVDVLSYLCCYFFSDFVFVCNSHLEMLRDYSRRCSEDHMWCQGLDLSWPHARQMPHPLPVLSLWPTLSFNFSFFFLVYHVFLCTWSISNMILFVLYCATSQNTPVSMFRDYFWQGLGDHTVCWGWNRVVHMQGKLSVGLTISLASPPCFFW